MKPYILPLSDSHADLETVGGKGMSLARLANAGLPVPGGFHVTTEAYRQFVAANDLQFKILAAINDADISQPATLETASASIGRCFTESIIPHDVESAIREAYHNLGENKPVAVRSSATAEDLPDASFAGQQETYLNIQGTESLLEAVKKCWASLWTARAIAYRIKNNIDQNCVTLAVVIQELVFAEAAGIMFTVNPLNGKRTELLINAAWGLGEAVVAGAVTPDTVTLDKQNGRVIRRETAEKQIMTVGTEGGTQEVPVPESQRKKAVLSDTQALELARLGMKIEEFYGLPMDVEWTFAESKFAVVQARPITALPPEPVQWILPNPKAMYARGSLAEHLPNPVSPLFGTLGLRPVNKATGELSDLLHVDFLAHDYQYRVINGYVYMGFEMTAKFAWVMVKVAFANLGLMLRQGTERWREARKVFAQVVGKWDERTPEKLSPSEILAGVRALMYAAGKYYTVIQSGTLPAASSSEIVFTRAYKLVSRKDEPKAERLLFGLETVPLRAEKSLFELGTWIRERSPLRNFMLDTRSDEVVAALNAETGPKTIPTQEWNEFRDRLEKHSHEFGHTSFEFDFMNPTPAETPELMIDAIKMYVEGKGADPYARQREAIAKREETVRRIQNRFKLIPNRWFNKALKWAMDSSPAREDSLADMGMGHTTVRRFLGELGKRFVIHGVLENPADIYWLVEEEVDELASLLERGEKLPSYSVRISARKAEWHEQMKLVPPPMLPANSRWAKMIPWARENESANIIKGLGASAGKVTATARLLFAPEDFGRMRQGDVLVAVTTTPAWTPLFTMASAVVTDIGGPLSHSSIVAREYGIPAVLATGVATRRIQDGQIITVDGGAGTVTLDSQ